ncbi:MAG: transcriptional regulator, partial [Dokdonella sp.]
MGKVEPAGRIAPPSPIADDGDEYTFCSTCAFGAVCLGGGIGKMGLHDLHCLVEHVG